MGVGHGHGQGGAQHAGGKHRWRLILACVLVGGFFVVELIGGLVTGSLALLSDAGHMAADVVTLCAALLATTIATRPDTTGRRTYGSYRAEIFASGFAVLVMLGVAAYVIIEAIGRFGESPEIATTPVIIVGAIGLVINVIALLLLRGGASESLNVKGAYLEVVADTAGSVGVIVSAILVSATGDSIWDTVVALAIGIFVIVRAVMLGRQVLAVLGQHAPQGLDVDAVAAGLGEVGGVADVHDLHIWQLTSGMDVATAHLVLDDAADPQSVLREAQALLRSRHNISHATLQVEARASKECEELSW